MDVANKGKKDRHNAPGFRCSKVKRYWNYGIKQNEVFGRKVSSFVIILSPQAWVREGRCYPCHFRD